jgi:hypothetical protein
MLGKDIREPCRELIRSLIGRTRKTLGNSRRKPFGKRRVWGKNGKLTSSSKFFQQQGPRPARKQQFKISPGEKPASIYCSRIQPKRKG